MGAYVAERCLVNPKNFDDTFLVDVETSEGYTTYFRMRPTYTLN